MYSRAPLSEALLPGLRPIHAFAHLSRGFQPMTSAETVFARVHDCNRYDLSLT